MSSRRPHLSALTGEDDEVYIMSNPRSGSRGLNGDYSLSLLLSCLSATFCS